MHHLLIITAVVAITVAPLVAQGHAAYPVKTLRVVVPSPAGGASDTVARLIGDKLTMALGKQVVVDNRRGAS